MPCFRLIQKGGGFFKEYEYFSYINYLFVSAVCVLVCLCFGGCMMGSLFAMSVAALLVGAQFWYIIAHNY